MFGFQEKVMTEPDFDTFIEMLYSLHDAVLKGNIEAVTQMDRRLVVGRLQDIYLTAEEIVQELKATRRS